MLRWKLIGLGVLLAGLLSQSERNVTACSGGSISMEFLLEYADVVVTGKMDFIDTTNQNGIFRVDSYLAGRPQGEYLAIQQFPAAYKEAQKHEIDVGCGEDGNRLSKDHQTILFLNRTYTGTYEIIGADYEFPSLESKVPMIYRAGQARIDVNLDYAELLELVARMSQETPELPIYDYQYPAKAPALVSTDNFSVFLLPVDGHAPVYLGSNIRKVITSSYRIGLFTRDNEFYFARDTMRRYATWSTSHCSRLECISFSPTNIYTAMITSDQKLSLCAYRDDPLTWGSYCPFDDEITYGFVFSDDERFIALWRENRLEIYALMLMDENTGNQIGIYSSLDWSHLIAEQNLNTSNQEELNAIAFQGTWSPDSYTFAYSDMQGLWTWNIFAENEPQLLVPAQDDNIPVPQSFSPQGHYLTVKEGNQAYSINIATGERLPDGLFSSDDQQMLTLIDDKLAMCDLLLSNCLQTGATVRKFVWLSEMEFIAMVGHSGTGQLASNDFTYGSNQRLRWFSEYCGGGWYTNNEEQPDWFHGFDFAYQPDTGELIVANNPYTISIGYEVVNRRNAVEYQPYDIPEDEVCTDAVTRDLTPYLDGEIVSVEWLPSVFYYD